MSSSLPRLVLTGPESTGKSTLAKVLCDRLQAKLVDEYLRDYFDLHGKIGLEDAIAIAQGTMGSRRDHCGRGETLSLSHYL